MGGRVAEAFAEVVEHLSGSHSSYAPRTFKHTIGRFNPTFLGYQQQDSHELIIFLLDGVHEDLNRIKKKPGTVKPDYEGGGDEELVRLADTTWDQYKSRNDSAIVDLFQGMYKSQVTCPDCGKVSARLRDKLAKGALSADDGGQISITFDPYMYVTLNLPPKKWKGWFYVVPLDPRKPTLKVGCGYL
jgi:ubiquitin carboxyl-terminal hydrolase 4/11/15